MKGFLIFFLVVFAVMESYGEIPDSILPVGFPESRYEKIWNNSPFTREVAPPDGPVTINKNNFVKSLTLEGVVDDNRRGIIAYVRNVGDKSFYTVTKEKNESHPYTITKANQRIDPRETTIILSNGSETGELGFPENTLTKKISSPSASAKKEQTFRGREVEPQGSSQQPASLFSTGKIPPEEQASPSANVPEELGEPATEEASPPPPNRPSRPPTGRSINQPLPVPSRNPFP